ncbi:hypothetical protein E2562_010449 [Oryza meyeriana var. granulata]|uniref:Uncharacterized protein n=1 Tax=Oryza meyeriana var. granulata TaxID=110450 RepID=A0A6G1F6V7_9ORYZ|nr:hypothetical protein E2562_010449 [Oryza meyeriana var. granulata]
MVVGAHSALHCGRSTRGRRIPALLQRPAPTSATISSVACDSALLRGCRNSALIWRPTPPALAEARRPAPPSVAVPDVVHDSAQGRRISALLRPSSEAAGSPFSSGSPPCSVAG